jgi:hypothetical protein
MKSAAKLASLIFLGGVSLRRVIWRRINHVLSQDLAHNSTVTIMPSDSRSRTRKSGKQLALAVAADRF